MTDLDADFSPERRTLALSPTQQRRHFHRLGLRVLTGPDAGKRVDHFGEGALTVGTASGTELALTDPTVSHYHLECKPVSHHSGQLGMEVRDLGSLNGTKVGGVWVKEVVIEVGARIELGRTTVVVEDASTVDVEDHDPTPAIPGLIGDSTALRNVARAIDSLASSAVNVLISGETGTGKELVARAIHDVGPRRAGPLVVVDCGALPDALMPALLFGQERADGAHRLGALEQAHGGTLFLDEVSELPAAAQAALSGALERRRFRRVDGTTDIEVDVRVVAATHRDLRTEANKGTFRLDLYYRLAGARIALPALRERPEDIPLLVEHFVREINGSTESSPFDTAALADLARQTWPGNVRELKNLVDRTLALGSLELDPSAVTMPGVDAAEDDVAYRVARARAIQEFEARYLKQLIDGCKGNASAAARKAQMDRPYLLQLLRRHGLR